MSSRADFVDMHLDFIIGGWNMLRYHSFYLLREMEDSRRIQLTRGSLPSFHFFWRGGYLISSSYFPSCLLSSLNACLCFWTFACLWQKPCLVYLSRLKGFKFNSILLTQSSLPCSFSPLPLYWESFFFLSHTVLMHGKVTVLPFSPPGQRAPSHMPCRLARSSEPLYWMITTQTKNKKQKLLFENCSWFLIVCVNMAHINFLPSMCPSFPASPIRSSSPYWQPNAVWKSK